jgi:DNA-binding CsgD family transcriptional regulator
MGRRPPAGGHRHGRSRREPLAATAGGWSAASFRSSLVPMVIADDQRRYVAVNPAACLLLRLGDREALQLSVDDLTPLADRPRVPEMWDAFLREGTQRGTYELQMPDGQRLTIEYSATANVEPGRHLSILMFPAAGADRGPQAQPAARTLTEREREVLGMVAMGMGSSWIAAALGVSTATVETHVRHCLDKLGARNRAHAIVLGMRAGEISLDLEPRVI